jgi:hypothetical protein
MYSIKRFFHSVVTGQYQQENSPAQHHSSPSTTNPPSPNCDMGPTVDPLALTSTPEQNT